MPRPESLAVSILLTALVSLGPLSTDMYLPSMPALRQVFGASVPEIQLTLSVFLAGFAISQLVYGPLSDRFGRRPVVLGGLMIFAAASTACSFAPDIEWLVLGRFFQALGACCGPVVGRAIVRDIYGPTRAATMLAYMGTAMGLAPMVAPLIGGYVTVTFGWQGNFLVLLFIGLVILGGIGTMLSETNKWRDHDALRPATIIRNSALLLGHGAYLGYVVTAALVFSGLFAFISGAAFVLIEVLGVPVAYFGYAFGAVVIGYMIGAFILARLNHRMGIDRMILIGSTTCLLAGLALILLLAQGIVTVFSVILPMMIYLMGTGMVLPAAQAGAVGPFPRTAGLASALLGFIQMASAAFTGFMVGVFDNGTAWPMSLTIALMGGLTFAWFRFRVWPRRAENPGAG
ncbi:MAG: multidrug effflux MFS transporter [Alphaproteobacteria bacterium]|jgi:DHA1 family bicyclomycin/chloramphenicol resistance-like MFS transporter